MATPTSPLLPTGPSPPKGMDLSEVTPTPPITSDSSPSVAQPLLDPLEDTVASRTTQHSACPPKFSLKDYIEEFKVKYKDKLVALFTDANLDLPALVKWRYEQRGLTKLLGKSMELANAYKNSSTRREQILEEYVAYLKCTDLVTLRDNAIKLGQKNLLSDISGAKDIYENSYNGILKLAMKALRYHEEDMIPYLQNPSILETLVEDAHKVKLIPEKVRNIFASLDSNISHSLKCKYLILHVNKKIANDLESFDMWLSLLYKHEGIHSLLNKTKIYCDQSLRASLRVLKERELGLGQTMSSVHINKEILKILNQSQGIKVHESNRLSVLLGVIVSTESVSEAKISYQWYKDREKLNDVEEDHNCYGSEDCIINILTDSLIVEGSYTCRIQQGDHVITSEPIVLTIKTPLDKYKKKLKDIYTAKPEVPEDTWPPVSIDTYINLALIKQQGIDNAGEYARCTIQGDADDLFKDKESIEYESVFDRLGSGARLLIEGHPGSGKTTLVHKVSKDWAKGKLKLNNVRLLFLVNLSGFFSDPNIKLRNILDFYYTSETSPALKDILKYADKHSGLGLCFILDGLDEYLPKKKNIYIYKLINRSELPKAVVIVASRPAAVADFRPIASRQIEVLGFLKEQISEYIKEYNFSDVSKRSELLKYLDHHPNVRHMCYLPIHTAMVCYLCQVDPSLPETETGIYKEFTIHFFLRELRQLNDDEDIYIDSIESLPSSERESYMKICKLAFEMTVSSKQIMKQEDVKKFFIVCSNRDYLGLITVDKVAFKYGFQKLYRFLHLTFQEFLTAYHISKLEEKEQTKLIGKYGNAKQMQIVWKFYCGLVKFNDNNKFQNLLKEAQYGTLYNVQCSFESQEIDTCNSVTKDSSLSFKNILLTPSDFTAIAFVISHASKGISKLVFDECTLGQEGIDVLSEKAKDKLLQVTTLCFHGHNCAAEQLGAVNRLMHALPSLEVLDLTDTQLGDDAVRALTGELKSHSNLQVLKIDTSDDNPLYSSNELLQRLVKSFTSKCSSFVNIWFPDYSKKHLSSSLSIPFYFCSNIYLRDINMSSCHLRPIEINIICNNFKVGYVCSRLSLINCDISDERAKTLSGAIKCSNIKILELSMNSIGDEGALALADSIESCFILQTVDLSCNQIGDNGALAIVRAIPLKTCGIFLWSNNISKHGAEILLQIKQNVDLNSLYIDSRSIGYTGAAAVSASLKLRENSLDFGYLHALKLCNNSIGNDGAIALANVLGTCRRLMALDLSSNMIGIEGAEALAAALSTMLREKKCPDFHTLSLGHNFIGQRGARVLADALKSCTSLCTIDICDNRIYSEGAMALACVLKNSRNLHTLDIAQNRLDKDGTVALADAIKNCNKLYKLNMGYNIIDDCGIQAIANALKKCSNLHMLDISHNKMSKSGAKALADSIKCCIKLQVLDVSYNGIGKDGMKALAGAIKCCSNLHTLNVAHLSDDGSVKALADAIKGCGELRALNISKNGIKAKDMKPLADALKQCSKMHTLDIGYNYLHHNGAETLCSALRDCSNLHILDISFNDIGNDGAKALAGVIECCTNLHSLDISCNEIDTKVIDDATKHKGNFHLVSIPVTHFSKRLWESKPLPTRL